MPYVATRRSRALGAAAPASETKTRRATHSGDGFPVFPVEPGWWFRPMLEEDAEAPFLPAWEHLLDSGRAGDDLRDRVSGESVAAALQGPAAPPAAAGEP